MKFDLSSISKPQLEFFDALYAVRCLLHVDSKSQKQVRELEKRFKEYLGVSHVFSFNAARSALFVLLKAGGVGKGDEVLIQAFTHVSVPNSILWNNAVPVYVDISTSTYNMNYKDLQQKITKKTKAIIVQHTFGLPADMDEIIGIAKKHKLFIIEDAAHALGAFYKGKKVGTLGDAAIFSFGATKVVDAASGGIVVTNDTKIASKVLNIYKTLQLPPLAWTRGQLLFLLGSYFIKPIQLGFGAGAKLYTFLREKKIIPRMTTPEEKEGKRPPVYPALMPDVLAALILRQFPKIDQFNKQRAQVAAWYKDMFKNFQDLPLEQKGRIYLRYTIQTSKANRLIQDAMRFHLDLTRMFGNLIGPADTNLEAIGYRKGSCPVAEKVALQSVDLPTGITVGEKEAKAIALFIKKNILSDR